MSRPSAILFAIAASLLLAIPASLVYCADYNEAGPVDVTISTNDFTDGTWIPISGPDDLAKIGSDAAYGMDKNYYLTNDIDLTSTDTNGGVDLKLTAKIVPVYNTEGPEPKITMEITVTTSRGDAVVRSINASMITSYEHADGNTVTLSKYDILDKAPFSNEVIHMDGIPIGNYVVTAAGIIDVGGTDQPYAYSMEVNTKEKTGGGTTSAVFEKTGGTVRSETFNSNGNFDPIGKTEDIPFRGKFDGNGHIITGLNVSVFDQTGLAAAGLFGYADGSTISNLGMEGGYVTVSSHSPSTHISDPWGVVAGGIVGQMTDTSNIEDSYNTGNVTAATSNTSCVYAGGIVGRLYTTGSAEEIHLSGCYNEGLISVSSSFHDERGYNGGRAYAGGICGDIYGDRIYTYTGNEPTAHLRVENCHNTGTVISAALDIAVAGGTAGGWQGAIITGSYNEGQVIASLALSTCAGGIGGWTTSDASASYCYNTGPVEASVVQGIEVCAGGLFGCFINGRLIEYSYNTGPVIATGSSQYNMFAGGLVGKAQTDDSSYIIGDMKMRCCYNTGTVTASGASERYTSAGGINGFQSYMDTFDLYNTGTVTASGGLDFTYAGGIAGQIVGSLVVNCYNTAAVNAIQSSPSLLEYTYACGIACRFEHGMIVNCYFLEDKMTINGVVVRSIANIPLDYISIWYGVRISIDPLGESGDHRNSIQYTEDAKTSAQMRPTLEDAMANGSIYFTKMTDAKGYPPHYNDLDILKGWSFGEDEGSDAIWTIDPRRNDGYPMLRGINNGYLSFYTISYDLNGGTGPEFDESRLPEGGTFDVASAESIAGPAGKDFAGWNTQPDGSGTSYEAGETVAIEKDDVTIYAIWKGAQYTVKYDLNGGTGTAPENVQGGE
ncbi:MAG: InlB B-repeat-containing protein, partial [Candidatus Methanoplasma sp.]|nr:InlB B-repeat-containing protein [Candidatus Methanoplasma sp.]